MAGNLLVELHHPPHHRLPADLDRKLEIADKRNLPKRTVEQAIAHVLHHRNHVHVGGNRSYASLGEIRPILLRLKVHQILKQNHRRTGRDVLHELATRIVSENRLRLSLIHI